MPDKQKDSKIMSMLERKGIIKKAGPDAVDTSSLDASLRADPDIRVLFEEPSEPITVKTAPRQPVPGMTTPIFPSDKPSDALFEEPKHRPAPTTTPTLEALTTSPPPPPAPIQPEPQMPAPYAEPPKPAPSFGGLNLFKNGNAPAEQAPVAPAVREVAPQPENYTDRYLNVNELYDALALRSKKTDTIYLIEEYLQTLPGSLPDSSRREIVSKLLEASGFDFDLLMGDGVLRVKMLKEYAERFARHTDDYIVARQAELEELDQQILRTRRLIENRKELHKKQFYTIEAEAQRLKEILTFISG